MIAGVACALAVGQYGERYRPQFHFSPKTNWTNDPCGLVYAFGKYQLFFQHNPFANVWGHMSWGHAASPDLVHWNQLTVAIRDDQTAAIFTGSSVFDKNNTSGLCDQTGHGCIVSIYTGFTPKTATAPDLQTQNLAVSQDGVTWTKYARNPVLNLHRGDTRDPKVFWYEPRRQWVMVIVEADERKVHLFSSPNLKEWHSLSEFGPQGATGGVWECPDLYPLQNHWVLKIGLNPGHISGGSGEQYFTGQFDGTRFKPDSVNAPIHWLDYGRDSYCALTFNNAPEAQAPRMIGWMNNWQYAADIPTSPWRGQMTLPRELSLAHVNGEWTLRQRPLPALESLRRQAFQFDGHDVAELNKGLAGHRSDTYEIETAIDPGTANQVELNLLQGQTDKTVVGLDRGAGQLYVDRSHSGETAFNKNFPSRTVAPLTLKRGELLKLHIFVDRLSVEVFAQDGAVAMTNLVFPRENDAGISIQSSGGAVGNVQFRMWSLGSIWQ